MGPPIRTSPGFTLPCPLANATWILIPLVPILLSSCGWYQTTTVYAPDKELQEPLKQVIEAVNKEFDAPVMIQGSLGVHDIKAVMDYTINCGKSSEGRVRISGNCVKDAAVVLVHEFGHQFGLDHNCEDPSSVMWPVVVKSLTLQDAVKSLRLELEWYYAHPPAKPRTEATVCNPESEYATWGIKSSSGDKPFGTIPLSW